MQSVCDLRIFDHSHIREDQFWNWSDSKELLMHRIHSYPAKFPAFLTPKIVAYLNSRGGNIESIADIFCGCGTSALESRVLGIDFWGYDINPVATLIAKAKSRVYKEKQIDFYLQEIFKAFQASRFLTPNYFLFHERLNYWFSREVIVELYRILRCIRLICPDGKYQTFFLTAFSNILKPASRWLTKSIKPQVDPVKVSLQPLCLFQAQVELMKRANSELINTGIEFRSSVDIKTRNILTINPKTPFVDLVLTSPPYVTSYEYADLHQLSTIWLGYVDDYRELRFGTIGSGYHRIDTLDKENLNETGASIVTKLDRLDGAKAKSVMKYFEDMRLTISQTKRIVNKNGYVAFVIGNTKYKSVSINNAKYLTNCLIDESFTSIQIVKRRVSFKILTPYRDQLGQFSSSRRGRKVYSHEYLIVAKK